MFNYVDTTRERGLYTRVKLTRGGGWLDTGIVV